MLRSDRKHLLHACVGPLPVSFSNSSATGTYIVGMFRKAALISSGVVSCIVMLGVVNAYVFVPDLKQRGKLVAYRGGGSQVNYAKLASTECTAVSLDESGTSTVENTLEAVSASLASGADVIHLNVHRTIEDQLVVFHDWTLDCATDASGPIHQSAFEELKSVDAGYGYTFDDGETFPFRTKGFRISRLEEFYERFPGQEFWLNLKNTDHRSFEVLYASVSARIDTTVIITSPEGVVWYQAKNPSLRLASVDGVKRCGIDYLLIGWSGIVPKSCRRTTLLIPPSKANYFWGFPDRLASRLQRYDSEVYLWARHDSLDPGFATVTESGVGVVTGDIRFMQSLQAGGSSN